MKRLKIGDILEIPLSTTRRAFGQYVGKDRFGTMIRIFKLIARGNKSIRNEEIIESGEMFPPVFAPIELAVKNQWWKVIGNNPIINFKYQPYVSTFFHEGYGKGGYWYLWDGEKSTLLGPVLPEKYKICEFFMLWGTEALRKRIVSGKPPFPYADLIANNCFKPRKAKPIKGKKVSIWSKEYRSKG